MTTKPCKYGCGTELEWNTSENAYFEVETQKKHFPCPAFKKNVSNFKNVAKKVEQEITQSSFKKTDALGRIAELEVQTHADIKDLRDRLLRLEEAQRGIVAQVNFMTGNEVKERQPTKYEEPVDDEVMED